MGVVRRLARRVLEEMGRAVAKDDLFEKPGERAPTERLPARTPPRTVLPTREAKAAPAPAAAPAATPAPTPAAPAPAAAPVAAPAPTPAPAAKAEAPVAPVAAPVPAPAAKAGAPAAPAPARKGAKAKPARPAEGCAPVDVAGLKAALVPSGRPLVVNHWATWCDPCVEELPRLVRIAAGLGDEAELLGVSWDLFDHPGDPKKVAKKVGQFAESSGIGFPSVLFTGEPKELFAACGLDWELIPQTVVFAPDGTVAWHHKGMLTDDDVFPLIRRVKELAK